MSTDYPKGAEWRKWDLHLHTPGTAKNDQFRSESDVWEAYIETLENADDIKVLGITDYFSIENYKKLKEDQERGRLQGKCLLPNIELRILPVTRTETPINIHAIFSPDLDTTVIEREFLRELKFVYEGKNYACLREDLIELGRRYKGDASLNEDAAWKEGIGQFNIPFNDLRKVLKSAALHEKVIVGVSNSNNDGNSGIQHSALAATRQEIYRLSGFVFSSNPNDTQFFLGQGALNEERLAEQYGGLKPCFTGSDAHDLTSVCSFPNGRYTWIKADPTFDGLKQAIVEPAERVYIGDAPPLLARVQSNRTKYIKSIKIDQVDEYDSSQGVWFSEINIPLNNELVAIIGNKGSGKSALADIIALCANYNELEDFSFLTQEKFLTDGGKIAKNFNATLEWQSGIPSELNLNDVSDETEILKVKYIPQGADSSG
jgi:hypothetical protein